MMKTCNWPVSPGITILHGSDLSIKIFQDIEAIAVDFDGVIVDSQLLHLEAWNSSLKELRVDHDVQLESITGLSVADFTRSLGLTQSVANEAALRKRKWVLRLASVNPPRLYPETAETLGILASRFRMALVSSCEEELVELVQKYYRLTDIFEVRVLEGDYLKPKPDPEPYQRCLEMFHLNSKQVLAVEDSPAGIRSARDADMPVVAVAHTTERSKLSEADAVTDNFRDVVELVIARKGISKE